MLKNVTANEVISEADLIAKQAMNRLNVDIDLLHARGYHEYAAQLGNMKDKIEKAMLDVVEVLS